MNGRDGSTDSVDAVSLQTSDLLADRLDAEAPGHFYKGRATPLSHRVSGAVFIALVRRVLREYTCIVTV